MDGVSYLEEPLYKGLKVRDINSLRTEIEVAEAHTLMMLRVLHDCEKHREPLVACKLKAHKGCPPLIFKQISYDNAAVRQFVSTR